MQFDLYSRLQKVFAYYITNLYDEAEAPAIGVCDGFRHKKWKPPQTDLSRLKQDFHGTKAAKLCADNISLPRVHEAVNHHSCSHHLASR